MSYAIRGCTILLAILVMPLLTPGLAQMDRPLIVIDQSSKTQTEWVKFKLPGLNRDFRQLEFLYTGSQDSSNAFELRAYIDYKSGNRDWPGSTSGDTVPAMIGNGSFTAETRSAKGTVQCHLGQKGYLDYKNNGARFFLFREKQDSYLKPCDFDRQFAVVCEKEASTCAPW